MKKRISITLIELLLLGGAGTAAYFFLLDERAKEGLKNGFKSVQDMYANVKDIVEERQGIVVEEEIAPNKRETIEQWERLGY